MLNRAEASKTDAVTTPAIEPLAKEGRHSFILARAICAAIEEEHEGTRHLYGKVHTLCEEMLSGMERLNAHYERLLLQRVSTEPRVPYLEKGEASTDRSGQK